MGILVVIIGLIVFLIIVFKWWPSPKKAPYVYVKPTLDKFKQASQQEKDQLFIEWCRRKTKSIKTRRTEAQLNDYVTDFNLPTFEDWKEVHGFGRSQWVERKVYTEWLKYIGAYNSKFDPDSPDWDGR